jgi:hypothetical protein
MIVARICLRVAWAVLLVGIAFATLALMRSSGDVVFRVTLSLLILVQTIVVGGLVGWIGLKIRASAIDSA